MNESDFFGEVQKASDIEGSKLMGIIQEAYNQVETLKLEKQFVIVAPDDFQETLRVFMGQGLVFKASGNLWDGYWNSSKVISIATSDTVPKGKALVMPLTENKINSIPPALDVQMEYWRV